MYLKSKWFVYLSVALFVLPGCVKSSKSLVSSSTNGVGPSSLTNNERVLACSSIDGFITSEECVQAAGKCKTAVAYAGQILVSCFVPDPVPPSEAVCPINDSGLFANESLPRGCTLAAFQNGKTGSSFIPVAGAPGCPSSLLISNPKSSCYRILRCIVAGPDSCTKSSYSSATFLVQDPPVSAQMVCGTGLVKVVDKSGAVDACVSSKDTSVLNSGVPVEVKDPKPIHPGFGPSSTPMPTVQPGDSGGTLIKH